MSSYQYLLSLADEIMTISVVELQWMYDEALEKSQSGERHYAKIACLIEQVAAKRGYTIMKESGDMDNE